jgi:hypothetical protein
MGLVRGLAEKGEGLFVVRRRGGRSVAGIVLAAVVLAGCSSGSTPLRVSTDQVASPSVEPAPQAPPVTDPTIPATSSTTAPPTTAATLDEHPTTTARPKPRQMPSTTTTTAAEAVSSTTSTTLLCRNSQEKDCGPSGGIRPRPTTP